MAYHSESLLPTLVTFQFGSSWLVSVGDTAPLCHLEMQAGRGSATVSISRDHIECEQPPDR